MSYTALIVFKDGKPHHNVEFRNSWGGAARIWDALFKSYIPKKHEYDSWIGGDSDRLWDLVKRNELPLFERAVHAFTFNRFYVIKEHLTKLSEDIRLFVQKYPVLRSHVDHLPDWAKWLDEHPESEAVSLYATSVGENLWYRPKKCPICCQELEDGDLEPVPLSEGTEVYDWLMSAAGVIIKP